MNQQIRLGMILALLAVVTAAPAALAQRDTTPSQPQNARFGDPNIVGMKYQDYFYGVITKITPQALVLDKTKVGVPQTVQLSSKTKYVRDGKKSSFAALKTGDMVYIDLKTNKKTGAMLARKVVTGADANIAP